MRASLRLLFALTMLGACGDDDSLSGPPDGSPDLGQGDAGGDGGPPDAAVARDLGQDMGPPGSAGCVSGAGLAEGEHTFSQGGLERRYLLYLPSAYTAERSWPLVFALHGNGGSVAYWNATSGDRNVRGELEEGAILVIAEAIDNAWRDYEMPPATYPERIEMELAYFDAILEEATTELCVDEEAIFSMGFSGGGSFSGVLGCRRDYIRAIAVGGSVIYFDEASCVSTPAAWITIGTEELNGGREAYRDFFRDRAGCESTASATDPDPCVAYEGCDEGTPVHYCQHPGDHFWPAFGTAAAWQFFQRFVEDAP